MICKDNKKYSISQIYCKKTNKNIPIANNFSPSLNMSKLLFYYVEIFNEELKDSQDELAELDASKGSAFEEIRAKEEEIANINALIAALQAKDEELDQKIDDLKAYVEGEISATEDWAEATFATLEHYADMQTEIADIKTLIETYKEEFTNG